MLTAGNLANLDERTLGEIAVALPGATALFRGVGLDYCCGGQVTLRDAAAASSLELAVIVAELSGLKQGSVTTPADLDTGSLIETIVTRFHRVHSQELPELIRLAERVEVVHQGHVSVPAGLAVLLKAMLGELTIHMQKEELVLFPQMNNGATMPLGFPIAAMMAEHQEHGAQLEEIKRLTHDLAVPADGCMTWRALYSGLAKFMDDLIEHIHIENNILFPRFL
ncbi:Nitric oxide-dependent regulator DnrN or NorA [Sphingobium indicum BiD32]|uniref:Nitric oxide-dependent regulator DnrN or NorA n=1 Tax=Sphingobium indicum BiD32 TaxID=1301087 RepID=N1MJY4_9SPHN|nr:iron-sulfur cluster repair di-iron protein [Sphingobium indicum]CCW17271.1 Nitric oxide-dependent regulator DnrN or NorA [Sphingobium indicum BiD32]